MISIKRTRFFQKCYYCLKNNKKTKQGPFFISVFTDTDLIPIYCNLLEYQFITIPACYGVYLLLLFFFKLVSIPAHANVAHHGRRIYWNRLTRITHDFARKNSQISGLVPTRARTYCLPPLHAYHIDTIRAPCTVPHRRVL